MKKTMMKRFALTEKGAADMLKAISFEVISATDGRSGYRMAVKEKPDIIILDWMMPEYNGLQFITDYRKEGYQTPVLFLTGKGDLPLYQIEALSAGADSYLSKGSDPGVLIERIRAMIRKFTQDERKCPQRRAFP